MDTMIHAGQALSGRPRTSRPGDGYHLLGEWHGCAEGGAISGSASHLEELCADIARRAGLTVVGKAFHQFQPQGVTGTVLLAESHLAIHTWPEARFVTIDVFVCNFQEDNSAKADRLYRDLRAHFNPAQEVFSQVYRHSILINRSESNPPLTARP